MPRSLQEVIDHADELATRFEDPDFGDGVDPTPVGALGALHALVIQRGELERQVAEAVRPRELTVIRGSPSAPYSARQAKRHASGTARSLHTDLAAFSSEVLVERSTP